MAGYEWSVKHNAWIKECSKCGMVCVGDKAEERSQALFSMHFAYYKRQGYPGSDGFRSHCKNCDRRGNQRRKGVIYGFNPETVLKEQGGTCALCPEKLYLTVDGFGHRVNAQMEHDHKTGKGRGIVCTSCNHLLGRLEKQNFDPQWLERAEQYLRKHNGFKRRF